VGPIAAGFLCLIKTKSSKARANSGYDQAAVKAGSKPGTAELKLPMGPPSTALPALCGYSKRIDVSGASAKLRPLRVISYISVP